MDQERDYFSSSLRSRHLNCRFEFLVAPAVIGDSILVERARHFLLIIIRWLRIGEFARPTLQDRRHYLVAIIIFGNIALLYLQNVHALFVITLVLTVIFELFSIDKIDQLIQRLILVFALALDIHQTFQERFNELQQFPDNQKQICQ